MKVEHVPVPVDHDRLSGTLTLPEGDVDTLVIMMHGGPGGDKDGPAGLFTRLATALADAGLASLRFDFRGAGDSTGDYLDTTISRQVLEFHQVLEFARGKGFSRIGVVGESLGATVVVAGSRPGIDAVVLLWPALYLLDGAFSPWLTPDRQAELDREGFIVDDGIKIGRDFVAEIWAVRDVESRLRQLTVPTLLVHGEQDRVVPVRQSRRASEVLPGASQLVLVPGGDHGLTRTSEQDLVVGQAVEWLSRHLSRSDPSGSGLSDTGGK
ncbi:MAG: alpha/beta hydrolase [Pseudonocardiaceae bacterium]